MYAFDIDHVGNTDNQLMKGHRMASADHENHPALRFVKPAFRQFGIELRNDSGERYAPGIGRDRDRNR